MNAQRGFVALLMIVLIAVGVFGAMAAWVASEPPPSKQAINQKVLIQAREALLAYVALSSNAANVLTLKTRLPCPDMDGDGAANTAPDTSNCGVARQTALGLLPWKTLGLPPLRDADGECLWYAVSGDFKDATDPTATTAVNADTDGVITVANEAGSSLATKLVAVVFAPGMKLGSQVRTDPAALGADKPCATPSGGATADAANYLDSGKIDPTLTPPTITFIQLTGTVDKQSLVNDQLSWITAEDYAATATPRNAEALRKAFSAAVQASGSGGRLPFAAATPGGGCDPGRYSGFMPTTCSYVDATTGGATTFAFTLSAPDAWPQSAFYAVAPGCAFNAPGCDTTSPSASALTVTANGHAKAMLLMRGRRQSGCPSNDTSLTELDQWLPCLESQANRNALANPMTPQARTIAAPDKWPTSNDVLKELP